MILLERRYRLLALIRPCMRSKENRGENHVATQCRSARTKSNSTLPSLAMAVTILIAPNERDQEIGGAPG
jgi:hypothetical protein